ncbi:cytochrome P450 [Pseudofrankia sp. DC12]|uniref:cytochrome P450 n=1 Tax=Pseudofrankia sp. DC12 TaxID=683315 RepID=UPI000698E256|nr:cytochrome P450 [Pseudofrankia sp. DC12]
MSRTQIPLLDLVEVTRSDDLSACYEQLHAGGAVVARGEKLGGYDYLAAIGYQAVRRAAGDATNLISAQGSTIPPLKTAIPPIPVEVDPPDHMKYRRLLVPELRPDRVDNWSGTIRAAVDHALDQFIEAGAGDLVDVAQYVPPAVIAVILGVPDDALVMVDITGRLNENTGQGDAEARAAANRDLMAYLEKVVTAAEGTDRTDLLGLVANAVIDGAPIGHTAALATAMTFVIAGQETTVNGIANLLGLLVTVPGLKERLLDEPALVPVAVEEALRLESPVQMMGRTAAVDTDVEGCPVRAGEKVGLGLGAANLDPAKFDQPGRFRLDRGANPHVAFGYGIHRCVGEHVARAEMTIAAEQVLARMPDVTLAGPLTRGANIPISRGTKAIPVRFTPGPRVLAR